MTSPLHDNFFFLAKSRGKTIDQKCHVRLTVPGLRRFLDGRLAPRSRSRRGLSHNRGEKSTPPCLTRSVSVVKDRDTFPRQGSRRDLPRRCITRHRIPLSGGLRAPSLG